MTDYLLRWSYLQIIEALGDRKAAKAVAQAPGETGQSTVMPANGSDLSKQPFSEIIKAASDKFGIDEKVIRAVIQQESGFNPNAVSRAGAGGLMQLMPRTAAGLGVKNIFDAEENVMAGVKYLRLKLDEFGGDLKLALAAYNAGSGAVKKHGGIPPYQETMNYVRKIMKSVDLIG